MLDFVSADYRFHLEPWYDFISRNGGMAALRHRFSNYAPLYLYFLTLMATWFAWVPKLYAIKLISVAFDVVGAVYALRIVRLRRPRSSAALWAYAAVLLAPTVVVNSSQWGQADMICTSLLLACLYYLMRKRGLPAMICFGLAFSIKLQAVVLGPLIAILVLGGQIRRMELLAVPAVYVATVIPAWLQGRSFWDLLAIYVGQAEQYRGLTFNAPNLYQWIPNTLYEPVYPLGLVVTAGVVVGLVVSVHVHKPEMTMGRILDIAVLCAVVVPFLLPKMHERYFFTADVVSIVFAFFRPRFWWVPVTIGASSYLAYFPFLYLSMPVPLGWVALGLFGVIVVLAHSLWGEIKGVRG